MAGWPVGPMASGPVAGGPVPGHQGDLAATQYQRYSHDSTRHANHVLEGANADLEY